MSFVGHIAKNTFNKVFINLGKELGVEPGNVQLGIYYDEAGNQKFCGYKNMVLEKDIDFEDYTGAVFDFSGGTEVIKSTIAQAGAGYASEYKVPITEIKIVMAYRAKELPLAVLMNGGKKERVIDIEAEFLK